VGFNDSNDTICYNDPGVAIYDDPANGTYTFEQQKIFRKAVEHFSSNTSTIQVFTKIPNAQPPSPQQRLDKAHGENIKRIRGDFEAYFGLDPSNLSLLQYLYFSSMFRRGIDASAALKRDIRGPLHKVVTICRYEKYEREFPAFYMIYDSIRMEKENVSHYLIENEHLSPVCRTDGLLLQAEAKCWKNFTFYVEELIEMSKTYGPIITLLLAQDIFNEMNQTLDEIMRIQSTIIEGK
jgi:hypothetical protein